MTRARGIYRKRRERDDGRMPEEIADWFAGRCSIPWAALLAPGYQLVGEWWRVWLREHPDAVPPSDAIPGQIPE